MKKKLAKYKNDKLIERNLLSWFNSASASEIKDGLEWYKRGSDFCNGLASRYGIDSYIAQSIKPTESNMLTTAKQLKQR